MKKADLVIDLQYGSTGKGLIAGYLGATGNYDLVVNANMPNAGHTYIDMRGNKMMHKVLPNGLVGKSVKNVVIGPGSVFDLNVLAKELMSLKRFGYDHFNLHIHEDAVVLQEKHIKAEQSEWSLDSIGSTKQGSAAAAISKIIRNGDKNPTAGVILRNTPWAVHLISQASYLNMLFASKEILIEGAQGYSLGLNAGFYPYCTSRDCTPARFMADTGVPIPYLRKVIGTARMHPIRVGGDSGPCYPDQKEISWSELGQPEERTTVTNRIRRVFTWSQMQMEEAMLACQPDEVFLNFCNYDPGEVSKVLGKIYAAARSVGCFTEVKYTGWGPNHYDIKRHML